MRKVSVIIPTYGSNTNPTRAIDSVLAQDYEALEVIVVDDNGAGTAQQTQNAQTFARYAGETRFGYLVHKINGGGSAARNTGVSASTGEYLCFLDDDDCFTDEEKLRKQMEAVEGLDDSWAGTYSSCEILNGDTYVRSIRPEKSGWLLEDYLMGKVRIETAAPVISRKAYDAVQGFNAEFRRHQDMEFFARILDRYQLKAVPEATYSRCYKDVNPIPSEKRLAYMELYTGHMERELRSIKEEKLHSIMKEKYIEVAFVMLHEGKIAWAMKLTRERQFGPAEYAKMLSGALRYVLRRARYGFRF